MTKNLLVELGLEELPAYVVTPSEKQLGEKMAAFLDDNRLSYESIQTFSTPRRLAVRVIGLADQQSDLTEDFKGPSKKIALDADGNFSKAAQGFVRGKGLTVWKSLSSPTSNKLGDWQLVLLPLKLLMGWSV